MTVLDEEEKGIQKRLDEELERLKTMFGLAGHLRVRWDPKSIAEETHGTVKGSTIFIFDTDLEEAMYTLKHEYVEYILTREFLESRLFEAKAHRRADSARAGLKTKNVIIRGYPTIIFCSAKLRLDEQEKTRVFLLSPEIGDDKLLESIHLIGKKHSNRDHFKELLETDPRRSWLMRRIHRIRDAGIRDVVIDDWFDVCRRFIKDHPHLAPRHQRDFPRLIALIKSHALLNWTHRESLSDNRIKLAS